MTVGDVETIVDVLNDILDRSKQADMLTTASAAARQRSRSVGKAPPPNVRSPPSGCVSTRSAAASPITRVPPPRALGPGDTDGDGNLPVRAGHRDLGVPPMYQRCYYYKAYGEDGCTW